MLKDTQNKYVRERRDSLKKTYYVIQKKNLNKMRVEHFWKESVHSRWDIKKKKSNLCQDSNGDCVTGEQRSVQHVG